MVCVSEPRLPVPFPQVPARVDLPPPGRIHGPGRHLRGPRRHGEQVRPPAEQRPGPVPLVRSASVAVRDRHLDREDMPSPPTASPLGRLTSRRRRKDPDHSRPSGGLTRLVTYPCSSPLAEERERGEQPSAAADKAAVEVDGVVADQAVETLNRPGFRGGSVSWIRPR